MESQQSYNIQFVSNITGINPHTIRAWEKRYSAITPQRDHNGRRMYIQSDIDRLNLLHDLVKNGNAISDIANLPDEQLMQIHEKFIGQLTIQRKKQPKIDISETIQNIYMGLEFFKLDIVSHEMGKACQALDVKDLAIKIATPVILKIRELKRANHLTPLQQDSLFLIIKSQLSRKLFNGQNDNFESKKVILAAPEGKLNETGILIAALLCQAHKLDFYYLGPNTKVDSLALIIEQLKPNLVFLGLNYSVENYSSTQALNFQESLASNLNSYPETWIGTFDFCSAIPGFKCIESFEDLDKKLALL